MKVLHLPVAYLPWTIGGREIYCHSLCKALLAHGIESIIAIHQRPDTCEELGVHDYEGIPIYVLPPLPGLLSRENSYTKTYSELPGFSDLIDRIRPDLVHFHDLGGGASLSHLRELKRRNIPAVLTYHSPGQTCPQTELLRYGTIPCDGEVRLHRCTACRLHCSGAPKFAASLAALAEWPGIDRHSPAKLARFLSGRTMIRLFQESLHEFFNLADGIVVYASWAREVLRRNGAPESKLAFIRTGGRPGRVGPASAHYPETGVLRLACPGRCTRIKGFHVLVDAIKLLPSDVPIEVHFLSPDWDSESYGKNLRGKIDGDPRFVEPRLVPNADLLEVLSAMDLVVIPSLWLETGPLTVFDAAAAGTPILGSRLGGIAELVEVGKNGWLFEPGDSEALAAILIRLLRQPDELLQIRNTITPLRTMETVAAEHLPFYRRLVRGTD